MEEYWFAKDSFLSTIGFNLAQTAATEAAVERVFSQLLMIINAQISSMNDSSIEGHLAGKCKNRPKIPLFQNQSQTLKSLYTQNLTQTPLQPQKQHLCLRRF